MEKDIVLLADWFDQYLLMQPPSGASPQPQPEKNGAAPRVTPVPEDVIKKFNLDTTFYEKHIDYKGFSILELGQGVRRGPAGSPLPHRQAPGRA